MKHFLEFAFVLFLLTKVASESEAIAIAIALIIAVVSLIWIYFKKRDNSPSYVKVNNLKKRHSSSYEPQPGLDEPERKIHSDSSFGE